MTEKKEGVFLRQDEQAPESEETLTVMLLKEIMGKLESMELKAEQIEKRQARIEGRQANIEAQVKSFILAFPNEDLAGHRAYHESLIKWANLRNELVTDALKKSAQAGLIGGVGWLLYAIYQAIRMELIK